jgi:predicted nucleic acid-binding protein
MTVADAFIDTNVLVYANRTGSPHHPDAVELLARAEAHGTRLWISGQVIREYLSVVTRSQGVFVALPMARALERARFFAQRFWMAEDGRSVRATLLSLLASHPIAGRQVHDANLVATMLAHGITHLLTFNTADFRRFGGLVTIEPAA